MAQGARLLENFLLHEVLVAALLRHDGVPGNVLRGAFDGAAVVVHNMHPFCREDGNVAVRKEKHFAGVLEQGRNIARDEIFSLAEANHRRRTQARGDNLLGIICGEENQRVAAVQRVLGDDLFKITKFSGGPADFQLAGVGDDGDARGIVATVLELAQSLDDDGHNFLWPDITDYSAHARRLLRRFLAAYHAGSLTKVNSGKLVTNQITVNTNSLRQPETVSCNCHLR